MLTLEEAIRHAKDDVEEVGADFVYNPDWVMNGQKACFYVSQEDPRFPSVAGQGVAIGSATHGCQVGRILIRAGLMTDKIASFRGGVYELEQCGLLEIHGGADTFLATLQREQDLGASAGDSLARGLKAVKRLGLETDKE